MASIVKGNGEKDTAAEPLTTGVRVVLGILFLAAGLAKLFALDETATVVATRNLPMPGVLAFIVGAFEALSGLMLLTDTRTKGFARALMFFVFFAVLLLHAPFGLPDGLAHANAISLTVDALVLFGLAGLARPFDDA